MWASQLRNYRSGGEKKGTNGVNAKKTYGSLYLNLKQKKPQRGGSPEGGYSLYSTESEDTPIKLSKDLDRCATLLSTLLEKDPVGRKYTVKPSPRLYVKAKCVGKTKAKVSKPKKDKRMKLSSLPRKQPRPAKTVAPPMSSNRNHNPVRVEVKMPRTTASPQPEYMYEGRQVVPPVSGDRKQPELDVRPTRMAAERPTGDTQPRSTIVSPLQTRDVNREAGTKFDTSHHPMAPFRPQVPASATPFNKRLSSSTPAMSPAGLGRPPHTRQPTSLDDLGSWPESSRSSRSLDFGPTPQCLNLTAPESVSGPILKYAEPVMEYQPVRDGMGPSQSQARDTGISQLDHQGVPTSQSGLRYEQSSQSAPMTQPTALHFSAGYYPDTRNYEGVATSVDQPYLPEGQPGYLAEFHENKENEEMNFDFGEYLMPSGVYEFGGADMACQLPLATGPTATDCLQMVPTREKDSLDQIKYEDYIRTTGIDTGTELRPLLLQTLPNDVKESPEDYGPTELEPIREEEEKFPSGGAMKEAHPTVSEAKDTAEKVKKREEEGTNNPNPSKSKPWRPPGKVAARKSQERESKKKVSRRSNSRSPDKEKKKDSSEEDKADPRMTEMKAHLVRLQCVSRELGVILEGDPEANRVLADLDNAVQRLTIDVRTQHPHTGLDLQSYPQTDLDLAMQPIRSENAQLRRRLRILNQQLREKERAERDTTRPDHSYHLVHLQTINQALQRQVNDGKGSRLQLQQRVQTLGAEIDQLNAEKRDMLLVLGNKDDDKLRSQQGHAKELMKATSDLRLAQQEVESLKRHLEAMEHDAQILHISLQQKEKEIDRLQHLVRGLQQSMTQLLNDLKSSRPLSGQRDSPHVQLAQTLLEDSIAQVDVTGQGSDNPTQVTSPGRQAWTAKSEGVEDGKLKMSRTADPADSPARRPLRFEGSNCKESGQANVVRNEGASSVLTERALREHQLSQYYQDKQMPPPSISPQRALREHQLFQDYQDKQVPLQSNSPQLSRFVEQNNEVDHMDHKLKVGEAEEEEFVGEDRWATIHDESDLETGKLDDFLSDEDPDETQYMYYSPPSRRQTVEPSDFTRKNQSNVESGNRESTGTTVKDVLTSLASKMQTYSGDEASSPGGVTGGRTSTLSAGGVTGGRTSTTVPRSVQTKVEPSETDSADQSRYSVTEYFKKYPRTGTTLPVGMQARSDTLPESCDCGSVMDGLESPPSTIKETESVSSGSTLETVTSFDDRAFQEGLANLDANIARIQDSLKQASKR